MYPHQTEWVAPPAVEFQGQLCLLAQSWDAVPKIQAECQEPGYYQYTRLGKRMHVQNMNIKSISVLQDKWQENFLEKSFARLSMDSETPLTTAVLTLQSLLSALPHLRFLGQQGIQSAQRLTCDQIHLWLSHQINNSLPPPAHCGGYET